MKEKTLGNYKLIEEIGRGGMGVVYKAYQTSLHRHVALKVLPEHLTANPDFVKRFYREAESAARLNHPNIIQIHDISEDNGTHFFTMEYVEGKELTSLIRNKHFRYINDVLKIAGQVASALECAYEHGIVHRDIKPGNIMINKKGVAKVADFGLAKAITADVELTSSGIVIGTPKYMSPEQGEGKKIDIRSDIYALGIVLYEMLTGRVPFQADTPPSLIYKHIHEEPLKPSQINQIVLPGLDKIVLKTLSKNPKDRYQTPSKLKNAIENFISDEKNAKTQLTEIDEPTHIISSEKSKYELGYLISVITVSLIGGYFVGDYFTGKTPLLKSLNIPKRKSLRLVKPLNRKTKFKDILKAAQNDYRNDNLMEAKNKAQEIIKSGYFQTEVIELIKKIRQRQEEMKSALKIKKEKEAKALLSTAIEEKEKSAQELYDRKNYEGAIILCNKILKKNPKNKKARDLLSKAEKGKNLLNQKALAEKIREKQKEREKEDALKLKKEKKGKKERELLAAMEKKKALELKKENLKSGKIYHESRNYSKAITCFKTALNIDPLDNEAKTLLAEAKEEKQKETDKKEIQGVLKKFSDKMQNLSFRDQDWLNFCEVKHKNFAKEENNLKLLETIFVRADTSLYKTSVELKENGQAEAQGIFSLEVCDKNNKKFILAKEEMLKFYLIKKDNKWKISEIK
jgi:serine/threonine protein kinase